MRSINLVFFFIHIFSLHVLGQQDYKTRQLTEEDGLSHGSVNCIIQDRMGFIWIGTDYGLNRYDGYTMKQFIHDPQDPGSISHNHINTLYEDTTDGNHILWVGTNGGGLNKFDLDLLRFTPFTHIPEDSNSISHNNVSCIYKDSHGVYWIGTAGGGLNKFNPVTEQFKSFQNQYHDNYSISSNNIRCIAEDKQGYLWVGTGYGLNVTNLYTEEREMINSDVASNERYTYHPVGTVWKYDPQNPQKGWIKKTNIPNPRWMPGSTTYKGKVYIAGGIGYQPPSDTPAMASMEIYDPNTDTWQEAADMNIPRAALSLTVLNDKIYAIGGASSRLTWGQSGTVVEVYDPVKDKWTRMKDLPFQICDHRAYPWKNGIFLVGGSSHEILDPYNKFSKFYTPLSGKIFNKASMHSIRSTFASSIYNDKIYVFGGMKTGADQGTRLAEVYDPLKNTWKSIANMPFKGFAQAAVTVNDKIWLLGGCERWHLQKTVYTYDPINNSWTRLPDLPEPRAYLSAEYINGKIYVFGGTGYLHDDSFSKDDLKFTRFRYNVYRDNSLTSSTINMICEDDQGILWIRTSNALRKIDRKTYSFIHHGLTRKANQQGDKIKVQKVLKNNHNQLCIVTRDQQLYVLNKHRLDQLKIIDKGADYEITTIYQDRSGVIWAGTDEQGIVQLIPCRNKFKAYRLTEDQTHSLSHNRITSLCEDEEGMLWIGTAGGILNKYNKKNQTFTKYPFDSYRPILDICPTTKGDLWLARRSVLTRFDPITGTHSDYMGLWLNSFTLINPSVFKWIDDLLVHKTPIASITKVGNDQHIHKLFKIEETVNALLICSGEAILNTLYDRGWLQGQTHKNKLWEMEAYKSYYAGGSLRNRIQLSKLLLPPGNYELHYQTDSKHAFENWYKSPPRRPGLWGILLYKFPEEMPPEIHSLLNKPKIATNRTIISNLRHIAQDNQGRIWCNINGWIHLLDTENNLFFPQNISIDNTSVNDVTHLFMDNTGVIWYGTDNNGLIRQTTFIPDHSEIDSVQYKQYLNIRLDPESLSSNFVTTIFQDGKNNIWIGTDFGLNKYCPGSETFKRYTSESGLLSDYITSIQSDAQNNIWISTNKGLSKLNPEKDTFTNYTQQDGISLSPFNHSCCLSKTGELYFGGNDGIVAFHPDSLKVNECIPPITITDFRISNIPVTPGPESVIEEAISSCGDIRLASDQNVLSFEFAALDFTYPDRNRYAYKLEGIDPDWIQTDASRRFITYTNLDPGEYRFRVKGSNNSGIWNENGTMLNILISPPWWQTWWFRILSGMMFIGILALIYRSRVAHLHKLADAQKEFSRKLIESQETERKRIASALHDSHGQNLLVISNELQRFQSTNSITEKDLDPLLETVKESIDEIRDISYNLHPHQLDRLGLKKAIESMIQRLDQTTEIQFSSQIDEIDEVFQKELTINIFRIIQEALNNIVKHAGAQIATISIKKNRKKIYISVSDDGKGFDLKNTQNGLGLINMEERVKLLGGKFTIKSHTGKGTSIDIILPKNINA